MSAKGKSAALAQTEKHFSKNNQPPGLLKKMGWAKKRLLANVLQAKMPVPTDEIETTELHALASTFGLTVEDLNVELAMQLAMAKEVIFKKNVAAFVALENRAYGLPKLQVESKSAKVVHVEVTFSNELPPAQEIIPIG